MATGDTAMDQILADEVYVGRNVVLEEGVVIRGRSTERAKRVHIGDNCFIGYNTRAFVDELVIGDYTVLHNNGFIAGDLPCHIGHCCWFGQHVILNSTGGLTIGNGVGVGAYSQLWSHIRHGDMLQGCRWNSSSPLVIDDDVWFVGHCIVSPIHAHEKSMALVGSVVTRDMEANHIYAGVPARDVTDRLGPQFAPVSLQEKYERMLAKLDEFCALRPELATATIKVVRTRADAPELSPEEFTIFDVQDRSYNRRRTEEEFAFMRYLLQEIKFFPREGPESPVAAGVTT
jgi:acetyltransferase-like isoleucine patch superfamily enzyme